MLSKKSILCLICLTQIVPMVSAQSQSRQRQVESQVTFNIDFEGGSLVDLMQKISEQNDGFVPNVMLDAQARDVEIPAIHFLDVDLQGLMTALDLLSLPLKCNKISNDLWAVNGYSTTGEVRIHNIRSLLDSEIPLHFKVDDIATAIQTAWDMTPSGIKPTMKVHLETGLMMIQGNRDTQEVAVSVIQQLSKQQESVKNNVQNVNQGRELISLKEVNKNLQALVERLTLENDALKHQIEVLQKTD